MTNQNLDFVFEEFAVKAIAYIDSIRSLLQFGDQNEIKQEASATIKESRINAFYRAIGLPAVLPAEKKKSDPNASAFELSSIVGGVRPDAHNNYNIHNIDFEVFKEKLDNRQKLFSKKATDSELSDFLDSNKYDLDNGIVDGHSKNKEQKEKRIRGQLFPMVVDGRIHVKPQARRVAGAFMPRELSRTKSNKASLYSRPLLEDVIRSRLISENIVNTVDQEATTEAYQTNSLQSLAKYKTDSLSALGKQCGERLNRTLNGIGPVLQKTVQKLGTVRKKTGIEVVYEAGLVAQENPATRLDPQKAKKLDKKIALQQDRQDLQNVVLSILGNDDNKAGGLLSIMIEILTPKPESKRNRAYKEQQKTEQEFVKSKSEIKSAARTLELLLGTFGGLSGVDVLVVITALFELDIKYLIALLNNSCQENMKIKFGNLSVLKEVQDQKISVTEAITKLQLKIEEIYGRVIIATSANKHANAPKNKPQNTNDTSS